MPLPTWKQQKINCLVRAAVARQAELLPLMAQRHRCRADQGTWQTHKGADYTPAEIEFMLAMDRHKREHCRPYPDCRDILAVVHQLGYRKEEGGQHATPHAT